MRLPQSGQLQRRARCSVTSSSMSGRSKNCRTSKSSLASWFWPRWEPQSGQAASLAKSWMVTWSGVETCSKVEPGCPFWPPVFHFDFWRRLLGLGLGLGWLVKFPLSVEGGLLLVRLLRSSSAIRFSKASTRSQSARTKSAMASGSDLARAISSSRVGRCTKSLRSRDA